jgi:hypothetical protein
MMFGTITRWFDRRRSLARMSEDDARKLLSQNPDTAYYDAQRIAARARFQGDAAAFTHWARVAAEVAKISDNPMDAKIVAAIVDEERVRREAQ